VSEEAQQVGDTPRWLHAWAVVTVCATLPLLLLGAEVTTKQVGMVDPQGFRAPWHMLTVPLRERGLGFVIEHSHRLAGFIVGTCIIVLAVGLWLAKPRRWVRWLGVTALAAVIIQGLLGGFRVHLNALFGRDLALIHGLFAQVVFALLVTLAVVTARSWSKAQEHGLRLGEIQSLRRWALLAVVCAYGQVALGAFVRHTESPLAPRLHLLGACVLVAVVAWLVGKVIANRPQFEGVVRPAVLLAVLMGVQLVLGVEAWLAKFSNIYYPQLRPLTVHPELLRSLHYLGGALVFAASVALALRAYRVEPWTVRVVGPASEPCLEGAA
jgi:cytochrome c oxidase assembly protein subunit 15